AVRKTDLVARLGGDEFAILAGNVSSPRDAERLASKLLASLREPMRVLGRLFVPSASLGIALLPRDGRTPSEVMKNADLALYRAKSGGRSTVAVCSPAMLREKAKRASLTSALGRAMDRGQID